MPSRTSEPWRQGRVAGGRVATNIASHGRSARDGDPRQGPAAALGSVDIGAGAPGDSDFGDEDDSLVKITFKADDETLSAINRLVANVRSTSKVAQRRVRSEVIRRALIAAAAAVELEYPSPREIDVRPTGSDPRSRRENDSFLDGDETFR